MAYWYATSKPRNVKGGIRAHSKRGDFGKSWWAKRWIKVLDGYDIGERISRGKSYLRKGQVLSIKIQKGVVTALVQGSDKSPYHITINVRTLSDAKWRRAVTSLFAQPATAAKLLIGQMPEDVEKTFNDEGILLFPTKKNDLKTDCTCYDWSNPCKHIVAVYLLIGEEFDRDPFLLFLLRGVKREEILKMAGFHSVGVVRHHDNKRKRTQSTNPLPVGHDRFWGHDSTVKGYDSGNIIHTPETSATLPKWLGNFQFWRGTRDFMPSLEAMYDDASRTGLDVFVERKRTVKKK